MPATNAAAQLESIHAMMARGHRSVRLERHTLVLWGLAGALLILFAELLFSPDQFDAPWKRIFAVSTFTASVLLAVGIADFRLTRRARAARRETLSFVQRQVTKVWWLLIGLIVVLEVGMNFFGGGFMFYGLALALMGLAFYVQGLFSQQMLSWVGVMLIALGLGSIAVQLPFPAQKWLAASALGVGLPLLALVIDRPGVHATLVRRTLLIVAWLLLVVSLAAAANVWSTSPPTKNLPEISLAEFAAVREGREVVAVRLPAESIIPVRFDIKGNALEERTVTVNMRLGRDTVVVVDNNGQPTGDFKTDDGRWHQGRGGILIWVNNIKPILDPVAGPQVTVDTRVEIH